jgi:hypothetical protein
MLQFDKSKLTILNEDPEGVTYNREKGTFLTSKVNTLFGKIQK